MQTASLGRRRDRAARRGVTLIVVMAALAACIVIAAAFLHGASVSLRIAENSISADRALLASECGIAAALSDMQSPSWAGSAGSLERQVGSDARGVWSYRVSYSQPAGDGTAAGAIEAALRLKITSVGTFLPAGGTRPIQRTTEAVVRFAPRAPAAGAPNDRRIDAPFDAAQKFALFVGTRMRLPPQAKIVGNVWSYDKPEVYKELNWSDTVRARAGASSPQPITGMLTVYTNPSSSEAANLTALLGSGNWSQSTSLSAMPTISLSQFSTSQTYRIYQGGPTYRSVAVSGTLDGTSLNPVVLGPTDSNPLGIFYRSGDVDLKDNVQITGTLVATGKVTFEGPGITIAAVQPDATQGFVSLPALAVGTEVNVKKEATATVTGAVYAPSRLYREQVDNHSGTSFTVTGSVLTNELELYTPPMWKALSSSDWNNRNSACPAGTPFLPWLANAGNWPLLFWPLNYTLFGLSNQPAFLVERPADVSYAPATPLFRPDPAAWNAGGGYRWTVLSWTGAY